MAAIALKGQFATKIKPLSGSLSVVYIKSASYSSDKRLNIATYKRGTGGRSSFNGIVATVFGCTGFVGRYVCNKLGKIGTQMILPYRGDFYDAQRLKVCGDLGQVLFTPFDLRDEESIAKAVQYSNVVINLIGRDYETKNFKYKDVHVDGPRRIARISRQMGVERFIHLSYLNQSDKPKPLVMSKPSGYKISKCQGECAVREEFPTATIFRASDIYGSEDRFLRYSKSSLVMARLALILDGLDNAHAWDINQRQNLSRMARYADEAFNMSDEEFRKYYRVTKDPFSIILNYLEPIMPRPTRRSDISAKYKILVALSFYATGGYQRLVGGPHGTMMPQQSVYSVLLPNKQIATAAYGSSIRAFASVLRINGQYMPLYKNGLETVKQPVYVSDVAQGIINAMLDPDTRCQIYQAVGPRRYLLADLVDWFYKLMRKDEKWGYKRYDMKYDPLVFRLKVMLVNLISPAYPLGSLHWEGLEKESTSDELDCSLPTLEHLCVQLTKMEDQVPWELKPYRAYQYYIDKIGEFPKPDNPKIQTRI